MEQRFAFELYLLGNKIKWNKRNAKNGFPALEFSELGFVIFLLLSLFFPILLSLFLPYRCVVDFFWYPKCKQHEQTRSKLKWKYSVWNTPIVYLETNQFFPFIFGVILYSFFFSFSLPTTIKTTMSDAISMIQIENERTTTNDSWNDKTMKMNVRKCVCWSIFSRRTTQLSDEHERLNSAMLSNQTWK